jgi:hypothetical protein
MKSFPVFATILASYRIIIRELPIITRLSWAPLAIVAIVKYLGARHFIGEMAAASSALDFAAAGARSSWWTLSSSVLEIVGAAIAAVALHEFILFGERKPETLLHLRPGPRELRFVLLAVAFGVWVVGLILLPLFAMGGTTAALLAPVTIIAIVAVIYLSVRLWPAFPIIVVTDRIALRDAWALTKGRFWSLAALGIVGMLPTMIAIVAISYVLPDYESIASTDSLIEKRQMVEFAQTWQPLRSALDFVLLIFNTAVGVALISFGYKALTDHPLEEPLPARA